MECALSTVIPSPLGEMLLCATERGLCAAAFGTALPEAVRRHLARYKIAPPEPGRAAMLQTAEQQLAAYFAGQLQVFALPLDLRGTPFQRNVWYTLQRIAYGETWAYSEVAWSLGRPQAAQAVGQAVGANPVAIIVPCHRVVGKDGTLTGYAGGLQRKAALLQLENSVVQLPIPTVYEE